MGSDLARFGRAWEQFTTLAAPTVAPEATYQAWLAHFAMEDFGVLRVVREVDFGTRYFGVHQPRFKGPNVMIDIAVLGETHTETPVVQLPRRSWLGPRNIELDESSPRSGLGRLKDFSVITELKVSATQGQGLDYGEVVQDFVKLSAILDRAEALYPENPLPEACVGVFDNHPSKRFNFDLLRTKIAASRVRTDVHLLEWPRSTDSVGGPP